MEYRPTWPAILAHLNRRYPEEDFEVSDGRVWRWLGAGDTADWYQFAFIDECYYGPGGAVLYRGNEL